MQRLSRQQLATLVALTLVWGINWPVMKLGVSNFPALSFRAITVLLGLPVLALVLLEHPQGLHVERDYDASIPEFRGDRAQLIQALLNIVQNAAQALTERIAAGDACITLRTRVLRQVTFGRKRYRLALELHVIDNGPGVPEAIKDRIFYPLVSGREGGSGLGLTLAQTFVQQHDGLIECESEPGRTDFRILLPLP